jgi:uncharacterized protein (TIGR01244 family)
MKLKRIDERVSVGGQPNAEDIRDLAREGFRAIVNLRREGEEEQPLSPEGEGAAAAEAGLRYVHLPISLDNLTAKQLDAFRKELQSLPAPVYVHCRGGSRAAVLTRVQRAVESGETGQGTIVALEQAGYIDDDRELRGLIERYVDEAREC